MSRKKGFLPGKLIYGIMVFILILIFNKKMYIVAGAWTIMSLGDGCSNIFGKAYGKRETPMEYREIMGRFRGLCLVWRAGRRHSHVVGKSGSCLYSSHTGANANITNVVLLFYHCVFSGFCSSRCRITTLKDQ